MPAVTASYSDTRSFTGGTLYPKVAAFIKNRIKAASQDAKGEKSAAAMAMGVGSRNDGVTKKEDLKIPPIEMFTNNEYKKYG